MYDMMTNSGARLNKEIYPVLDVKVRRTYSLANQFCNQLNSLMTLLYSTEPRYIRCIKPTAFKKPNDFNSVMSIEQLRYSGVFEAVKIRKQGYPFRYKHKAFVYRYRCITLGKDGKWPPLKNIKGDSKKCVQELLALRKEDFSGIKLGNTMCLYKAEQNRLLELMRNLALDRLVPTMQRVMKGHLAREMRRRLKKCSGMLDHALKVGNDIELLERAIQAATDVIGTLSILFPYTPKRLPEAIELKRKLIEWTKIVTVFKDLVSKDINKVYDQLGAAIVHADSLMDIPHTKDQTSWYDKAKKAIESCASAKIEPKAKDALYSLESRELLLEVSNEAGKVGYTSPTVNQINEYLKLSESDFVKIQLKKAIELNDPIRKINREIALINLYLDANSFLFPIDTFKQLRHPIEFANQKMLCMNRDDLAASFLKWTVNPIHTSLTELTGPNVKDARNIFKSILGFMQDRKYSNPDELAVNIIKYGLEKEQVRSEIYLQIIKQLTGNPNPQSVKLGWVLMWLCCSSFPPGYSFENHLLIYIKGNAPDPGKYMSAMHVVKYDGPRKALPTNAEISSLKAELDQPWKRSRYSVYNMKAVPTKKGSMAPISPSKKVTATILFDFVAADDNMLSVKEGTKVEVVEQEGNDWWLVRTDIGEEGYVPCSFVQVK